MIGVILILVYICVLSFLLGVFPWEWESRPTLQPLGFEVAQAYRRGKNIGGHLKSLSLINRPLCQGFLGKRIGRDLIMAHVNLTPEEFFLIKEGVILLLLGAMFPIVSPETVTFWLLSSFSFGYFIPEIWLKGRISRAKYIIIKELPDIIDLLGLCVNAGLDFMLALKWVVDKSPPSVLIEEMNTVMQEINMGKTRRDALKDFSSRYDLLDLHSFCRTIIQADKMGTSVSEALNILSEDMRLSRYRRGEQIALKAPMKMLIPLLLFIFPTVAILVVGPIFIDFIHNNPMRALTNK